MTSTARREASSRLRASRRCLQRPESVTNDVKRISSHPLIPGSVAIYGYIYDVKNGQFIEVPEATNFGKPR